MQLNSDDEDCSIIMTDQAALQPIECVNNLDLMKTRLKLDQNYFEAWYEGKRIRKKPDHVTKLVNYFNQSPIWDYQLKVHIAEELGMTFNQVGKWNWDYRRKVGIQTRKYKMRVRE